MIKILKSFLSVMAAAVMIINFGDITMAEEILTTKQHNIVMISSYTAKGDMENLELAINKGLDEGLSFWRRFLVMPAGKAL